MIDVKELLYEICEDERVYEEGIDLIESGLLDSYAFIELFSKLEDNGIEIQPTRIDRAKLRTKPCPQIIFRQSRIIKCLHRPHIIPVNSKARRINPGLSAQRFHL